MVLNTDITKIHCPMNVLEILHRPAFIKAATRADSLECRAPIYCRSRNQDIPSNTHELFPEPPILKHPSPISAILSTIPA